MCIRDRVKNVKLFGAYGSDQISGVVLRKRLGLNSNFVRFKFFEEELNNKYPYLSSVKDFDKNNPKFRWQKKFSSDELANLFPKIGGLRNIEILDITSTGRVKNVKLIGA